MLSYLTQKGMGLNCWQESLKHCLFDYRTTPHGATGCRSVDVFLGFRAKGMLSYQSSIQPNEQNIGSKLKNKSKLDKNCENRLFKIGDSVFVKNHFAQKFSLKGEEAIVLKQLNFDTLLLRSTRTFRIFSCSSRHISPIAAGNDKSSDTFRFQEVLSNSQNETLSSSESDEENAQEIKGPILRRSQRRRQPPDCLYY